jgi:hypothetical protein
MRTRGFSPSTENRDYKSRSDWAADSRKRIGGSQFLLRIAPALILFIVAIPSPTIASNSAITLAADRMNTILPPPMPQQTIVVGVYNGATNTFGWSIEEGYPPGIPPSKQSDEGGPVHPLHFAPINSYNVVYRFNVINRPPGFQLTLRLTDAHGQLIDKVATLDNAGASVSFNPPSAAFQTVIIQPGELHLTIVPNLRAQLGAFVVPNLLVSVLYAPPGDPGSYADYTHATTIGTVVSWDFARTSGMVDTMDPNQWQQVFGLAMKGISLGSGSDVPSAVGDALGQLFADPTVQSTSTFTRTDSNSQGVYFTIGEGWQTDQSHPNQYPGTGDVFAVMHDVLFVYFAKDGKVFLAPVAKSKGIDVLYAWQLTNAFSPPITGRYLALDPMSTNHPPTPRAASTLPGNVGKPGRASRFQYFDSDECQAVKKYKLAKWEEIQSTSVSLTNSYTEVTQGGGYITQLLNSGTPNLWGMTYGSSLQQVTSDTELATVYYQCNTPPGFWIDFYFDSVFRTILAVQGEPLPPPNTPAVASGTLSDEQGHPLAMQRVSLAIGERKYTVFSDSRGNFQFRLNSLPAGQGTLIAGKTITPITFSGRPISEVRLRMLSSQVQPPPRIILPAAPPGIDPRLSGGIRPRSLDAEPISPEDSGGKEMPQK